MENNISKKIYDDAITEFIGLCNIPHVSNAVEKPNYKDHLVPYRDYLTDQIKTYCKEIKIYHDDVGNIWFDIPASKGCNNFRKIILQAHMDMVWDAQKEALKWDKWTHPVAQPVIEKVNGELVMHSHKNLTSLGIDDGEGVALILSVLKNHNNFKHGKIRCLLTTDEEPGIFGVQKLGIIKNKTINVIKGYDYLLNIDTPLLNTIITSSAGCFAHVWDINTFAVTPVKNKPVYKLIVKGCQGGHSADRIDDGLANAVKLANTIIKKIGDVQLISFATPNTEVNNKIPKEAEVVFTSSQKNVKKITQDLFKEFKKTYKPEKNMSIVVKAVRGSYKCIKKLEDSKHIIDFIDECPYGPLSWFEDDHFVESSSNIAPVTLDLNKKEQQLSIQTYSRSANQKKLDAIVDKLLSSFKKHIKSNFKNSSDRTTTSFNPWEYKKVNPLRDLCVKSFKKIGIDAKIYKVHCGLECSYFAKANPNVCQISIGPQTDFEHNVNETLHLKSYQQIAEVVLNILSNLKK